MKSSEQRGKARKTSMILAALLMLQMTAAVFFVADALADLIDAPASPESAMEALVAVALGAGVVMGIWQLRLALRRMRAQDRALNSARGSLAQVIDNQFSLWRLTPAEQDVGLLALKGLDVAQIAEIRGAASGTVRAQLTSIYAKAGVSGRAQFAAWFVEDLLEPNSNMRELARRSAGATKPAPESKDRERMAG
ncbi:helix-turn-helix transcriptional regulator [Breoghania sp.]|uniref:helix-turn-helix transcriptional regulator n=1 Tax=Breoghania sp. TaxID=2065378 RepID=UPI002AA9623C|nr:helix-turn-helix transcriptional regulator [Breoghania sp.]